MNNSINQLVSGLPLPPTENLEMTSALKLPPEILAVLKQGQTANLKITADRLGQPVANLQVNHQTFAVEVNSDLLALFKGEPLSFAVKLTPSGQVRLQRSITSTIEQGTSSSDMLSAPKDGGAVMIAPLKIAPFINKTLESMQVPPQQRVEVSAVVSSLRISVADIGVNVAENTEQLQPLMNILRQIAQTPQQIETLKPQLVSVLENLVGQHLPAETGERINEITVVKTPLGDTFFETKVKLPLAEPLLLKIDAVLPLNVDVEIKSLDNLLQIITGSRQVSLKPETLAELPQLKQFAAWDLGNVEHLRLAQAVVAKLPFQSGHLLENIYNFYQGAVNRDITRWLGKDLAKEILSVSAKGIEPGNELQNFLLGAHKETPSWRIVEMPLFDGTQFTPLKIALKKESDKEKSNRSAVSGGTRFIVETDFSRLGSFQFDGFSNITKRSLDLIIRTSAQLDDDFCANIINLFKKSMYNLDYTGSVKINRQEAFISLTEETKIGKGIYV